MHSTVQTGLYTPNMFSYDYNKHHHHHHHHHHPNSSSNTYYHFSPASYKNHLLSSSSHHLYYIPPPTSTTHSHNQASNQNANAAGIKSINASLLAINNSNKGSDGTMNKSLHNISKLKNRLFASNLNLDKSKALITKEPHKSNSLSSTAGGPPIEQLLLNNETGKKEPEVSTIKSQKDESKTNNLNIYKTNEQIITQFESTLSNSNNINEQKELLISSNDQANKLAGISANAGSSSSKPNFSLFKKFKQFWQCTRPCGILTIFLGICLIISSVFGFLVLFHDDLCTKFHTCYNGMLKVGTVSALVIGIFVTFIGFIIAIYTKKDEQAKIIIASGRNLDAIDYGQIQKLINNNTVQNGVNSSNKPQQPNQTNLLQNSNNNINNINPKQPKLVSSNVKDVDETKSPSQQPEIAHNEKLQKVHSSPVFLSTIINSNKNLASISKASPAGGTKQIIKGGTFDSSESSNSLMRMDTTDRVPIELAHDEQANGEEIATPCIGQTIS
jgi:hypothetical protein